MFSSKSLRNVPEDHGKQLCAANGCLGNGSLDRKFSAICAQSPRHTEVTHAATGYTGFREAADVCSVFGTETFRDKTIDRTSDGIGSRTTEDIAQIRSRCIAGQFPFHLRARQFTSAIK